MGSLLAIALATVIATALPASAHTGSSHTKGTSSLAALLAKDGSGFDRNWNDFDIVDNAVSAVLTAKPKSAVGGAGGRLGPADRVPADRPGVPPAGP